MEIKDLSSSIERLEEVRGGNATSVATAVMNQANSQAQQTAAVIGSQALGSQDATNVGSIVQNVLSDDSDGFDVDFSGYRVPKMVW